MYLKCACLTILRNKGYFAIDGFNYVMLVCFIRSYFSWINCLEANLFLNLKEFDDAQTYKIIIIYTWKPNIPIDTK